MLEKEFAEKIIVVTGASRGIGAEIAREFSRQGAEGVVMVSTGGNQQKIEEVALEVEQNGSKALIVAADLSTSDSSKQVMAATRKEFGRLNALVNVAGISKDRDLFRMSIADWDTVMAVNLRPAYFLTQAGFPLFPRGGGSVTNISSIVGIEGNSGQENYAASKAGLIGLTKSLAQNVGRRGIRVNAVAPGFIDTDMTQSLGAQYREDTLEVFAKLTPLGRIGRVQDVASVVAFLANDRLAGFITGQTLIVDGGIGGSLHATAEVVKMKLEMKRLTKFQSIT